MTDLLGRIQWSGVIATEELSELRAKVDELAAERERLAAEHEQVAAEREHYRKLYLDMLEVCRKLERGIVGQKRERLSDSDSQLTMSLLGLLLDGQGGGTTTPPVPPPPKTDVAGHTRAKPTGRKPLPESLPRIDIEILPPEVQAQGLDAFERIGEDVSETVERRPASLVVVRTWRPKFVAKDRERNAETQVAQAEPPELPIERGLAGPSLLADTVVRRFADHLPLHRLERIYGREGLELARSTVCGWHDELAALVRPLIAGMWLDAFTAPYLCTDATGVLVQDREKCRRAHFWVVIAPGGTCSSRTRPGTTPPRWTSFSAATRATWSPTPTRCSITSTATATSSRLAVGPTRGGTGGRP